jgi:hypothetical protein
MILCDEFLSFYILAPGTPASMNCKLTWINHLNAYCNRGWKVNESGTDENTGGEENIHYLQVRLIRYSTVPEKTP